VRERSLVAGVNALFRSIEAEREQKERVLFDPHARIFGETHWLVSIIRALRFVWPPLARLIDQLQTVHCVRHRSIDELILRAIDDGYRQLILLGPGYETRAVRFKDRARDLSWIEIDHPNTGSRKTALLQRSALEQHNVVRRDADLEKVPLRSILEECGFAFDRDACFVLEGLIHYLPLDVFRRLLDDMGSGTGRRRVVLSFIRPDMAERAPELFVWLVELLREIPDRHFSAAHLERLAHDAGFLEFRSWPYSDQLETFAREGRGRPAGVSQDVALLAREIE
jgi:methyltransferase (TIGR00027 family)